MSTETLDRLALIIDGLSPLGNAGPGEPVVAAEWNTVVNAVQELARIAIARERTAEEVLAANFARADHGHDSMVNLNWFEPETRSMIEGGRAQRADLASELQRTQRDVADLRARLDELRTELSGVKSQLDDIDDRDRNRATSLDRLSVRVESFNDNAVSIADLRSTLGGIDDRVGQALAFRDEITDDAGQPIDMATLRSDVAELLEIRENLTAADGRLVEYRDFERRLAAVEDGVDDAGGTPPGDGGVDLDGFRAEILEATAELFEPRLAGVESGIGDVRAAMDGVDARVMATQDAVAGHTAQLGALQTSIAGLPDVTTRVGTLENRVAAHDVRFEVLDPLPDRMAKAEFMLESLPLIEERLSATESDLERTLGAVARIDELDTRVLAIEQLDPGGFGGRLDAIEADLIATRANVVDSGDRLVMLESRADDQDARFAEMETLTNATRETLTLLARDVDVIRTGGGSLPGGIDVVGPGGIVLPPGGGVAPS